MSDLLGRVNCHYVSLHLTQLKVPQWVICLLMFCMAVSLPYLLNMPYVPSLTALFRPFLNVLLVCKLQWSWFVLLLRMPLRPCLYRPISVIVRLRLQLVHLHGFQPSTFGWLLALHVNLLLNRLGHIVWLRLWGLLHSVGVAASMEDS